MTKPYLTPRIDRVKVKPYVLEKGYKNIAIVFLHGLGDTMLFRDVFDHLKAELPHVNITLFLLETQEPLIENAQTWRGDDCLKSFDESFVLEFPMSEGSNTKKAELCACTELGLDHTEFDIKPFHMTVNRQVALHFQGTALPESTNPPEHICKKIYDTLVEMNYLPIEVHFQHLFHNPVNTKHPWISTSVRGNKATIHNLYSTINNSSMFIGVASGPLIMALSIMPHNVICLQKNHHIMHYTNYPVRIVDVNRFDSQLFVNHVNEINKGNGYT